MMGTIQAEFDAIRAAPVEAPARPPGPSPEWLAKTPEQRAEYQRQADEYEQGYREWERQDGLDAEYNPERRVRAAEREALRAEWEAEKSEELAAAKAEKAAEQRSKGHITLTAVVDKWAAEMKPGHRAETRARKVIEDFQALNGKLMVQAVMKKHVLAYKEALIAEGQSAANANLLIGWVGTIHIFAMDKLHLIESNPAARIRIADKRRGKDKRRAFEAAELKAIFESPVYASGLRPAAGGGEAAYWLPLLALYTGARQTELGQLHPDDIAQEAYRDAEDKEQSAWVMRIVENAERGQRVKNEGSERRVPIHADLIALGFVTLAQHALAQGRSRIFPDIVPNSVKVLMGNWSKWFGRYRRKACGVTGKDTPFHSFRHTFKHHARLVGIPNETHNEFTGHETGDVADTYGGLSYPLHPLVEGMKRYRVPGFKLPPPSPGLPGPFER